MRRLVSGWGLMTVSVIAGYLVYSIIPMVILAGVGKRCPQCVIDATPPFAEVVGGFGIIACIALFVAGLLWALIVRGQHGPSDQAGIT